MVKGAWVLRQEFLLLKFSVRFDAFWCILAPKLRLSNLHFSEHCFCQGAEEGWQAAASPQNTPLVGWSQLIHYVAVICV